MAVKEKNILYRTISELNRILRPEQRKKSVLVFCLIVFSGLLEVFGLAVVLPVVSVALNPDVLHTNAILHRIYVSLHFNSETSFLYFMLASLLIMFVIKNSVSVLITYIQSKFSFRVATDVARSQFNRYFARDLQFFNNTNSNILYQNIRSSSTWLSVYVVLPLIGFFSELLIVLVVVAGMAVYDYKIFLLVSCTLAPVFLVLYRTIKNRIQILERKKAEDDVEANKHLFQTLDGYVDVKLFNKETFFIQKFVRYQDQINAAQSKVLAMQSMPNKVIEITAVAGVILIILYSIVSGADTSTLLPLLSLYILAAYRLMPSLNRMLIALMSIKSYSYLFDIFRNLRQEATLQAVSEGGELHFNSEIELREISYKYPEASRQTLQNVSLKIKKGERIGIIGQSGSGKTTLINVLLRFIAEDSGQIIIDRTTALSAGSELKWRDLIGYVKQNVFILDGDFYENIAFGVEREDVDIEKLTRAVRLAQLEDLIQSLPKGLNTNIGENGAKLSGGQRQRIAIARALYKDAQILIFDEATSALDHETEKEITQAIDALSNENKTMIIVAHRITTLKNCDRILEFSKGRVVRVCSYADLVQN